MIVVRWVVLSSWMAHEVETSHESNVSEPSAVQTFTARSAERNTRPGATPGTEDEQAWQQEHASQHLLVGCLVGVTYVLGFMVFFLFMHADNGNSGTTATT